VRRGAQADLLGEPFERRPVWPGETLLDDLDSHAGDVLGWRQTEIALEELVQGVRADPDRVCQGAHVDLRVVQAHVV
jgi:hypothetical protein